MQPVTEKNLDGYGTPAIDWNRVSDRLASYIGALVAEFSSPSAGPPPWFLYRLRPKRIYALGTAEP